MKNKRQTILASDPGEQVHAAAELGNIEARGLKSVKGVAYSGGALSQYWSSLPLYIDLAGMSIRAQVPLLYNHYNAPGARLGVIAASIAGGALSVDGGIDPDVDGAKRLIEAGRKIPWQLSIGASVDKTERLEKGDKADVNGREVAGPALIVRASTLREVSVVAVGADSDTHLHIAASLNLTPSPEPESKKESIMDKVENKNEVSQVEAAQAPAGEQAPPALDVKATVADVVELKKICSRHPDILVKALDANWSVDETRKSVLEAIQAGYAPAAPAIHVPSTPAVNGQMLQAALLQSTGSADADIIKACGQQNLEAADKRYHGQMTLQGMIIEAALANGYPGGVYRLNRSNWQEVCQAAVSASWSHVNLPNVLGGVVNRRLLEGFGVVDQSWREIADIASVNDFKAISSYRLVKGGGFQKVEKSGEIKHGELDETGYSNSAETYGEMLSVTRENIINDDLNALTRIPFLLGQDAGLKFNELFWTEFLDDATFFSDANGNLLANNPLDVAGLTATLKKFRSLKDESGRILGARPVILLVSSGNEVAAQQLFADRQVIPVGVASTKAVAPASNPHAGKFRPVVCPYLSESTIAGNSDTAYYLLAAPAFRAAIQAVFLNGVQAPTVETSSAAFNVLGFQWRAYMDWGAAKQDKLAGVKAVGTPA